MAVVGSGYITPLGGWTDKENGRVVIGIRTFVPGDNQQ